MGNKVNPALLTGAELQNGEDGQRQIRINEGDLQGRHKAFVFTAFTPVSIRNSYKSFKKIDLWLSEFLVTLQYSISHQFIPLYFS